MDQLLCNGGGGGEEERPAILNTKLHRLEPYCQSNEYKRGRKAQNIGFYRNPVQNGSMSKTYRHHKQNKWC